MRVAAIDIGTNSVLMIVAEKKYSPVPDSTTTSVVTQSAALPTVAANFSAAPAVAANLILLQTVADCSMITRLGQGVDRTGQLQPEAMARTIAALEHYAAEMLRLEVEQRMAIGTSVLRDAQNGGQFLSQAEAILGCPIEVVSGPREAALVLAGVKGAFGTLSPNTLIFDVGGGSTEFILSDGEKAVELISLDMGAVRFTERYILHDPPQQEEMDKLRDRASQTLLLLPSLFHQAVSFIGVAGTVTSLASVALHLATYDTLQVNGSWLNQDQIEEQITTYANLTLAERKKIIGLHPGRADVILAGALIVSAILQHFNIPYFQICDRGVRWGLLWDRIKTN